MIILHVFNWSIETPDTDQLPKKKRKKKRKELNDSAKHWLQIELTRRYFGRAIEKGKRLKIELGTDLSAFASIQRLFS